MEYHIPPENTPYGTPVFCKLSSHNRLVFMHAGGGGGRNAAMSSMPMKTTNRDEPHGRGSPFPLFIFGDIICTTQMKMNGLQALACASGVQIMHGTMPQRISHMFHKAGRWSGPTAITADWNRCAAVRGPFSLSIRMVVPDPIYEFGTAIRLRRAKASAAQMPRFRASAVRDGRHDFAAGQVMGKLGGAAKRRMGWEVNLTKYDTEVFAVVCGGIAVVGLPLFAEWRGAACGLSDRPERFFVLPREVRPYLRPDVHMNFGRMRLRPSTCFLLLQVAGVKEGSTLLDPMGGVGTIAIEAAVRIPHVRALTSDISWDATQAAKLNVAAAAPHLASGSTLVVSQEDARSLPNEAASIDFVVTDVPFGNRNRLVWVNGLLPAFLAEMSRVLRPGGRAALLMTRGHARQVMQLLGTDETLASFEEVAEEEEPCDASETETTDSLKEAFRQLACHKVGVGGWPAAVLALERRQTEPKRKVAEAEVRPSKGQAKGSGKAAKKAALGEPCECLLIERPISCPSRRLVDLLMQRWPSHFPTESVGRRVMGRGRVWVEDATEAAEALRQAWWSEPVTMKSVVFFPDYPRRSPYAGQLTALYQDNCVAVVVKEPGLRIFGGIRTLANLLAAWPPPLIASTAKDALPAPVPVHFLEAELGGCFLVAKTAEAAFRLGRSPPRRQLRALLCGEEPLRQLQGHPSWRIRRVAPSVRFTKLTEASCPLQGPVAPFREECARERLIILGDLQYAGEEAPKIRRSQVYLFVDSASAAPVGSIHGAVTAMLYILTCGSFGARLLCFLVLAADSGAPTLECYTDASFAPYAARPYTGIAIRYCGCLVLWRAAKQSSVTLSSSEAELVAATERVVLTLGVGEILQQVTSVRLPIKLLMDNAAALQQLQGRGANRTRHLRIRSSFFKEKVDLLDGGVAGSPRCC
ncbi:Thumpd3 [Symbiodinium sp. CCMP2592]|nr:Thumpd3 [Symbiodinium sp. CCMP2592]